MSILNKLSRPLLSAPFIASGLDAVAHAPNHREPARKLVALAERAGIEVPELKDSTLDLITRTTGIVTIGAGLALARSKAPRSAALILAALQTPIALANNPVWETTGAERSAQIRGLLASAGLIGGALTAVTDRSGAPSVAWRASKFGQDVVADAQKKANAAQKKIEKIGSK